MPPNILQIIANNPSLLNAVKETILKHFPYDVNPNLGNEEMGQVIRAVLNGRQAVESAFREIERHKTPAPQPEKINIAR